MASVSEFLVVYLDSIDERLSTTSTRTTNYAPRWSSACATTRAPSWKAPSRQPRWPRTGPTGSTSLGAFVAAYAPEEIEELEEAAPLMSDEVGEDTVLTEADRAYLAAVEALLDTYPEMRLGRVAHSAGKARSTASVRSASERCRYRVVVAMLAWPRRRWTTWMSAPRRRRLVA